MGFDFHKRNMLCASKFLKNTLNVMFILNLLAAWFHPIHLLPFGVPVSYTIEAVFGICTYNNLAFDVLCNINCSCYSFKFSFVIGRCRGAMPLGNVSLVIWAKIYTDSRLRTRTTMRTTTIRKYVYFVCIIKLSILNFCGL